MLKSFNVIQTIITTQKSSLDISVLVPDDYVGKQLHVLIYKEEEVNMATAMANAHKKPSDFFGTMTLEEGEKMHEYVAQSRKEWERDI